MKIDSKTSRLKLIISIFILVIIITPVTYYSLIESNRPNKIYYEHLLNYYKEEDTMVKNFTFQISASETYTRNQNVTVNGRITNNGNSTEYIPGHYGIMYTVPQYYILTPDNLIVYYQGNIPTGPTLPPIYLNASNYFEFYDILLGINFNNSLHLAIENTSISYSFDVGTYYLFATYPIDISGMTKYLYSNVIRIDLVEIE